MSPRAIELVRRISLMRAAVRRLLELERRNTAGGGAYIPPTQEAVEIALQTYVQLDASLEDIEEAISAATSEAQSEADRVAQELQRLVSVDGAYYVLPPGFAVKDGELYPVGVASRNVEAQPIIYDPSKWTGRP